MSEHTTAQAVEAEIRDAVIGGTAPFHEAQDRIVEALRRIDPNAKIDTTRHDPGMRAIGRRRMVTTVTASLRGWSPSLHEIRISGNVGCVMTGDEDAAAGILIRRFAPLIAAQNARAAEGMFLFGRLDPLQAQTIFSTDAQHLHVDRALVEMCRDTGRIAWDRVTRAVSTICTAVSALYDGGSRVATSSGSLEEAPRADGRPALRTVGFPVHIRHEGSIDPPAGVQKPSFDGAELGLPDAQLPDTVLAAIVGRPLGDLVQVHEEIDERIVRAAARDPDGAVRLALDPDLVPVFSLEQPIGRGRP